MSAAAPITPRIPPLPPEEWTSEAREVFAYWEGPTAYENGSRSNTMMTLAQHPRLAIASQHFGKYVLVESDLSTRQRELIVLRIAWRYNSAHQWTHHVLSGRKIGMVDAEFEALRATGPSSVWCAEEQAIIDAVDQLCDTGQVENSTWNMLAQTMDTHKLMDILYAIGMFTMNAWAFNAMGIELELDVAAYSKPAEELVKALET
ncbi:MAG: carboxymuconolactone decarboxylase family protein [Novosphingobium sp.]